MVAAAVAAVAGANRLRRSPRTASSLPAESYRFLGHHFTIRSNSAAVLERLRLMYGRFLTDVTTESDRTLQIVDELATANRLVIQDGQVRYRMSRVDGRYHFTCRNEETSEYETSGCCEPGILVQNALLRTVAVAMEDHYFFHAGVAARRDRAIILAADSRMGKTTLVLRLAALGCRFLSDEVACLGKKHARVEPFPRAVNLREDGMRILGLPLTPAFSRSGASPEGVEYAVDAEAVPGVRISGPCKPGCLVFLRGFGDTPRLEPVSKTEALFDLTPLSIKPLGDPGCFLRDLAPLVDAMTCYRLVVGHPERTARLLLELVEDAATTVGTLHR